MPDKSSLHQQLGEELNSLLPNHGDRPAQIAVPTDNDPAPEYRMNSKGKRLIIIKTARTNK